MKKTNKIKDEEFAKMDLVPTPINKHVKNNIYLYFSYSLRLIIMFLSIIIIGILSYKFYNQSFSKKTIANLSYEEIGTISPKMEIQNNIDTDFNYNYKLSAPSDLSYSYYIIGTLKLVDDKNNIITKEDYNLVDKIDKKESKVTEININHPLNIDYDYYNKLSTNLKQSNPTLHGNLNIKMYINISTSNSMFNNPFYKEEVLELTIPVLTDQVSLTNIESINNKDIYSETIAPKLINEVTLYISITLLIIDTIFLLLCLSFILRTIPKKSKYDIAKEKILRDYDDKIVNCKDLPNFKDYTLINCTDFNELLDACKLLNKPILYNEIVKNQKSTFVIINENNLYRYTLKECDLD